MYILLKSNVLKAKYVETCVHFIIRLKTYCKILLWCKLVSNFIKCINKSIFNLNPHVKSGYNLSCMKFIIYLMYNVSKTQRQSSRCITNRGKAWPCIRGDWAYMYPNLRQKFHPCYLKAGAAYPLYSVTLRYCLRMPWVQQTTNPYPSIPIYPYFLLKKGQEMLLYMIPGSEQLALPVAQGFVCNITKGSKSHVYG